MNGKKRKIGLQDFQQVFTANGIHDKVLDRMVMKFRHAIPAWERMIENSFLEPAMKASYQDLIKSKFSQLGLNL